MEHLQWWVHTGCKYKISHFAEFWSTRLESNSSLLLFYRSHTSYLKSRANQAVQTLIFIPFGGWSILPTILRTIVWSYWPVRCIFVKAEFILVPLAFYSTRPVRVMGCQQFHLPPQASSSWRRRLHFTHFGPRCYIPHPQSAIKIRPPFHVRMRAVVQRVHRTWTTATQDRL